MKPLDQYRKRQKRLAILFMAAAVIAFALYCFIEIAEPLKTLPNGGPSGALMGIAAVLFIYSLQKFRSLKSDEALKEAKAKEKDERLMMIEERSGFITLHIFLVALFIALIVASLISDIVFYTLMFAMAFLLLVYVVVHAVCNKKY